jgi:hypothetical protein
MIPEAAVGERELLALYARYKRLALGTRAGLMLDAVPTELVEETRALVADCRRAAAATPHGPLTALFEACTGAAVALHELVLSGREEALHVPDERLSAVRASHSRLRRDILTVTPCEYVPCSAVDQHTTQRT